MSHSFEAHAGEVRLELDAASQGDLFAEAGQALAELMMGEPAAPSASAQQRPVEAHGADKASLLVEWLNELISLSETSKRVFTRFEVSHVGETEAIGLVWGVRPAALKTAVKAATLHDATVEEVEGRWRASVVLDV